MAAAAPWSFGAQIHEELTCSICLELFTRPKVLPCQHTFCQDCLEVHAGKEGSFECPKCRQKTTLPSQGVAGLPDNSMAASMCETFQQQATLSTKEVTADKCSIHNTEEVKLYCKQCRVPVCVQCLEKAHNGHSTTTIKNAIQESESSVQALINEGRNILESYSLTAEEKKLNAQKQQRDNGIIQAYNQMVLQKLAKRRDQLLSESEKDHKKNLEEIQNRRKKVSADINELSAACDQAELEMDKVGAKFVRQETTLKDVVEKYREKAAPTPVQTQPAVFQPTDTPVPVLGYVKAGEAGHHQGNQEPERVTFGGRGSGTGQFRDPVGVAVPEEGEIFVADRGNKRIQVFTLQGTFVRQFPTVVSGDQVMKPTDVAVEEEGNLWVVGWTDDANFAVMYNKQGKALAQIDRHMRGVTGVAVDTRRNHILITQATEGLDNLLHGEVEVFRPDGTLVRTFGEQEMKDPHSITVDRDGNIVVSDRGKQLVFVYNEYGQFLFSFGEDTFNSSFKPIESKLMNPRGICTMPGNIIISDTGSLKVYDSRGYFRHKGFDNKVMQQMWALAIGTEGQLVVTDGSTDTVTIFS